MELLLSARAHRRARPGLLERLIGWNAVLRQRSRLARLDDHLLDDIGLSRHEVEVETARAPWDAPGHWMR